MIEVPLHEYLCKSEQLTALLAIYEGEPAIFHQIAYSDTDEGWDGLQYARIVYSIDKSGDVERKASGTLYIDIVSSNQSEQPEEIEAVLKELIDGYFFVVDGMTYAAKWERSDGYTDEKGKKVYGTTIMFSLLAFPLQNTSEPDTVALMNNWAKAFFPDATIINVSATQPVFTPTDEAPAIYWSFQGLSESPIASIFGCTWTQSNLTMHVMAPSEAVRNAIVNQAANELNEKMRVLFPDRSPFTIHRVTANMTADPVRTGQLIVSGSYGILRQQPNSNPLNNVNISQK